MASVTVTWDEFDTAYNDWLNRDQVIRYDAELFLQELGIRIVHPT